MMEPDLHPDALARWRESLLAEADVGVGALAEQYLPRTARERDKEAAVSALSAFLSSPETRSSVAGLLDRIDVLIVGTLLVARGLAPEALGRLLAADLAYHDLEYRLANLQERLILFRARTGEYEVAPQLVSSLAEVADAGTLFGPEAIDSRKPKAAELRHRLSIQELCFMAWALLREGPDPVLKGGGLSARAKKRILELGGGDEAASSLVAAVLDAFAGLGMADAGDGGHPVDQKALALFLASAGEELPYALAAALAGIPPSSGGALKAAFDPFITQRFEFSASGLERFAAIAATSCLSVSPAKGDQAAALKAALLSLGLVAPESREASERFSCVPERVEVRWKSAIAEGDEARIAVDGSGGIQALPPASPGDLAFLVGTAGLVSASGGWRFRLGRESTRKAFADGWTVPELSGELERLSGHALPQSVSWDLDAWRAEYESVRLFKGYTLVLAKPVADLVEKSGAFARIPHEALGGGVFFFGAAHAKTIEEALTAVGLPAPSLRSGFASGKRGSLPRRNEEGGEPGSTDEGRGAADERSSRVLQAARPAGIVLSFEPRPMVESLEPSLRDELERIVPDPAERRGYEEMLDRKLVYTMNQLRAIVEKDRADRRRSAGRGAAQSLSAVGLDFNGKLRIIQAAFKTKFSRLDAKWTSGAQSLQALVRPVSLRRTEKDYELEGENLSTGRPVTIRVGSLTYIGLKKGYFLGDK